MEQDEGEIKYAPIEKNFQQEGEDCGKDELCYFSLQEKPVNKEKESVGKNNVKQCEEGVFPYYFPERCTGMN